MSDDGGVAWSVLHAIPSTILVVDSQQRVVYANPAFWAAAGVPPGSFPSGRPVVDAMRLLAFRGAYGLGDPEARLQAVVSLDRTRPFRRQVRGADGRLSEIASFPLPCGGWCASGTDVTHMAEAEAAVRDRLTLLEDTLSRLTTGVSVFDADLRLRLANQSYAALIGAPAPVLPGISHRELLALIERQGEFAHGEETAEGWAQMFERERHQHRRRFRERKNGTIIRFETQPTAEGGLQVEASDVTALRAAEDEARARAALLNGVLSILPHGVMVYGADRRVAMFNAAYARIMEGAEVSVGEHIDTIAARRLAQGEFDAGHLERTLAEQFRPAADGGQTLVRTRPNGTAIAVRAARLPDGGHISVVTDITALHQAEAAAAARATVLDGVLATLPHGVCVFGPDRRVALVNAAYQRIMHGAEVAVGDHSDEIVARRVASGEYGADYGAQSVATLFDAKGDGSRRSIRVRPNGTVIAVRAAKMPDGGHVSVITDISAQAAAEAEARDRAAVLEASFGSIHHGIAVFGPDRRLRAWNKTLATHVGADPSDYVVGRSFDELVALHLARGGTTEARAGFVRALDRSRAHRYTRPGLGGRTQEVSSDPMPDGGFVIIYADITDRVTAEAAARDRAAQLETSLAAMRHGLTLYDAGGRVVATNPQAAEIVGCSPGLLAPGSTMADHVAGQLAAGQIDAATAAHRLSLDRHLPQRYTRARPDGRVIEIVSDPTPDGGFVVTISDVTALAAAETAARERAQVLEASFSAMRHGFNLYGPDHRLIAVNVNTSALAGFPEDRPRPGMHLTEVIAAQLRRGILTEAEAARVLALDRSKPHRYTRRRPDGKVIEILSDPTPDGGFVVTFTDVTELTAARQEAQDRAAMLEAALSAMRHGIAMYGPDRRLRASNLRAAEVTGMLPEALPPGRLMDAVIDEQVAAGEITPEGAAVIKGANRSRPFSHHRRRPNGRELEVISDPMADGGYVITYTDVTEDRRIRAELERARAAAEAASQAKSRFLATMTHELRSPLSAMIGFSEAILAARDPARIPEFAGAVRDAGRHLLMLVDDILDVARSQTGALAMDRRAIELPPVLEGALLAIQPQAAEAGLTLQCELAPGLPQLIGDARRLRQVLLNLLSNAVKFTPAGGRVTMTAAIDAAMLVIDVADTGIGIPAEHRDRVFEPFSQIDSALARRFQGSGLGLHLARNLAEAMGGALTLVAQNAPGTRVRLAFPASCLTSPRAAPTSQAALEDTSP